VVGAHARGAVMDARSEVLARIRSARDAGAPPAPGVVPRDYAISGRSAPGSDEAVARLDETLTDYRATVTRVAAESDVAAAVVAFLDGASSVVVPPGLPESWLAGFVGRVRRDEPAAGIDELDAVDAVVTGAAVAIADTGTFVLDASSPDQGRRAITLVPDHHVCVVRAADVVCSVPEAIARLDPTHPLTFVSGPSATSDIELNRVEGVHGPRRLDVVLVGALRAREY
jgi:L-lactate dehydrogenase complex protein LldG